jgi:predicted KAP-like P-loop ATPase
MWSWYWIPTKPQGNVECLNDAETCCYYNTQSMTFKEVEDVHFVAEDYVVLFFGDRYRFSIRALGICRDGSS